MSKPSKENMTENIGELPQINNHPPTLNRREFMIKTGLTVGGAVAGAAAATAEKWVPWLSGPEMQINAAALPEVLKPLNQQEITDYLTHHEDESFLLSELSNWYEDTVALQTTATQVAGQVEDSAWKQISGNLQDHLTKHAILQQPNEFGRPRSAVEKGKILHWWRLNETAKIQAESKQTDYDTELSEILDQAGFPPRSGAFYGKPKDQSLELAESPGPQPTLTPESPRAQVETAEDTELQISIENPPDVYTIDGLNHTDVVHMDNNILTAGGHFDKENYVGWHVAANFIQPNGQKLRYEPPIPGNIVNNFDPAFGSIKVNNQELLSLAWCERGDQNNPSNAKIVRLNPATAQPYQGVQPEILYQGNVALNEFVDYTEMHTPKTNGRSLVTFTLFGPNGADSALFVKEVNGQTRRIGEFVNPEGTTHFANVISYNEQTKESEVAYTDWGNKEVKITKMNVDTGQRGETITLMKYGANEFVRDNYKDQLIFRHTSIQEVIKLESGGYAISTIVDRNNQTQVRVDVVDDQGNPSHNPIYVPQPDNTYRVMPSIVEVPDQTYTTKDNQQVTIPGGVMVQYNQCTVPEKATEWATFIGKSQQGWGGPLLYVTGRISDKELNFRKLYAGDRKRTRWFGGVDGAAEDFSFDGNSPSPGQATRIKIWEITDKIYMPIIMNATSATIQAEPGYLESQGLPPPDQWPVPEGYQTSEAENH